MSVAISAPEAGRMSDVEMAPCVPKALYLLLEMDYYDEVKMTGIVPCRWFRSSYVPFKSTHEGAEDAFIGTRVILSSHEGAEREGARNYPYRMLIIYPTHEELIAWLERGMVELRPGVECCTYRFDVDVNGELNLDALGVMRAWSQPVTGELNPPSER